MSGKGGSDFNFEIISRRWAWIGALVCLGIYGTLFVGQGRISPEMLVIQVTILTVGTAFAFEAIRFGKVFSIIIGCASVGLWAWVWKGVAMTLFEKYLWRLFVK